MNKARKFNVAERLTLTLEDLSPRVIVITGIPGVASVNLAGSEKLLEGIKVEQPKPDQLTIKGTQSQSNSSVTQSFSSGGFSMTQSVGRSSSQTSFTSNIGGRGKTIISSGDLVIVNGKVISGGDNVTVIEGEESPSILVTVPVGTDLEIYDVEYCDAKGLGGRLDVSLNGQYEATIDSTTGVKVNLDRQSKCKVTNAGGDLHANLSGQSSTTIKGNLNDVDATVSGQSGLTIIGNCRDFIAEASGMSRITLSGDATGRVKPRVSGMSSIDL